MCKDIQTAMGTLVWDSWKHLKIAGKNKKELVRKQNMGLTKGRSAKAGHPLPPEHKFVFEILPQFLPAIIQQEVHLMKFFNHVTPRYPTEEKLYSQTYIKQYPKAHEVLPEWIIGKMQSYSGELPLFHLGLLSTRKDEQLSGQSSLQSLKPSRAGREVQLYCRRAQSHKYLMATVCESSASDPSINFKPQITTYGPLFGRPTRSNLLRSTHQSACRSGSLPVEHGLRRTSSEASGRAARQKGLEAKSLEETVHSFLIGARYNRSFLDSKSFQKYGLFISKSQPGVSFLKQCKSDHQRSKDQHLRMVNDQEELRA
ncbi:uncharacterized protein PAF06_007546 [Gastrophryne carolinensis]